MIPAADDFAIIAQRLREIEAERLAALEREAQCNGNGERG